MNLVLLFPEDFIEKDRVRLRQRRFRHLIQVNRVKEGDQICCGLINGPVGKGKVTRIEPDRLELQMTWEGPPPEPLPLTLVLALPRPKMLKRIIESTTALGVKEIYLINSWRVEKSYWQSPLLLPEHLGPCLVSGLEQGKDTVLPVIHQRRFFRRFVTEELPAMAGNAHCYCAHPKTTVPCPRQSPVPVILAVGPEGGFIDIEVETFEKAGFQTVHAGSRIMKVETAVPYLIAALTA